MRLNEKDSELFKTLNKSTLGKDLVDYLERVISYTCDVRNMTDEDSAESVKKAANVIQVNVIDKIKLRSPIKEVSKGQFE